MPRKSRSSGARARSGDAKLAHELLHVTMRLMRGVATEMRRAPQSLEPGQMATLMRLSLMPAAMGELAKHLGVSVPTVSKSIDVLVERGWVERWIDPSDRRQTIVRLTPAGRGVAAGMKKQSERYVASLLKPLKGQDRTRILAMLDVLKGVLPQWP
jgi:DNA-binding MarR family transcriptional regulator